MIRKRWLPVISAASLAFCAPAAAIAPPVVDRAAVPPNPAPPPSGAVQRGECLATGVIAGSDPRVPSASQTMMDLPAAWQFTRGEGQTVAVIDTGVRPGARLPNVDGGGDYLASTDGLTDCDGRGTAVAGIIAGQPGPDGFTGVAPAARVLSIRQTSAMFAPASAGRDPLTARAVADVDTLARAVVSAADQGARVINVSTATCVPATKNVDQTSLGAALRYAAIDKDAVIVAAAGDATGPSGCASNPLTDLSRPNDPRNWAGVGSIAIPSWWQPYVLSVASVAGAGQPSSFTMAGPWVGIAAPGEGVVSVSNGAEGGLANGFPTAEQTMAPIHGTGYAAAYVSGVAALVRSRFPELTAGQVIDRLTRTAHNAARSPSNLTGAGVVDAVAALTWQIPSPPRQQHTTGRVSPPPNPPDTDPVPRIVAFAGVGALAAVVGVVAAGAARRKAKQQ